MNEINNPFALIGVLVFMFSILFIFLFFCYFFIYFIMFCFQNFPTMSKIFITFLIFLVIGIFTINYNKKVK